MSIAESFGRSGFARFINSTVGRVTRVIAGLAIIGGGYSLGGTGGTVLMIVGLVPLGAGIFNLCVISALLGGPLRASRMPGSGA
jgi:hypothetical protein